MKPLYIKKNGQVEKVTGAFAMPATYPAERVAYDNTNSGLSADDAQGAIDEIVGDVNDKVDKETGKGLSTNDFTNEDKALIGQTLGNNTVLTTDKTPFLTRQTLNPTGFSGYVREKLIGASYAWNQLVENGNFASTSGWTAQRGTISASNNVLSYTLTEVGVADVQNRIEHYVNVIQGHKYLLSAKFKPAYTTTVGFRNNQSAFTLGATEVPSTTFTQVSAFFNATATTSLNMYFVWVCGDAGYSVGDVNQIKECQITDLTLAFGSTIADHLYSLTNNGGITKLRDMGCPIDKYTAYGNYLVSSKTSGKVVGSANLFDEEYPSLDSTIRYRGIYLGVGTYTMSSNASESSACALFFLDGNVSTGANNSTNGVDINHPRTVFSESGYVTVAYRISTVNPTNANTQIERGSTPTTYEKSWHTTYSLGNDELRGKFDLVNGEIVASGDVKESNGEITRGWKEIDLGSLDYQRSNNAGNWDNYLFYAPISDMANYAEKRCAIYTMSDEGIVHVSNKCITRANNNYLYIRDDSYTDATTFKTAMNGVYLVYELATSTTEQSTPFADPMSLVGATTEEYIDTRDIPCPVGAERQYMGQSEDVIEIPSMPQSDGIRYMKAITSGGKTQLVWDDVVVDISDKVTMSDSTLQKHVRAYRYGKVIFISLYTGKVTSANVNTTLGSIDASIRAGANISGNLALASPVDFGYGSANIGASGTITLIFSKTTTYSLYATFAYVLP